MTDFATRVRRVRLKGGADVHVLHNPMQHGDADQPENWRGKLVEHAKMMADNEEDGSHLDGFIVIGLFSDGTTSIGCRLPDRLPRCLVPAYIGEVLRRDVIVEREAERVFDSRFEWVE